MMLKHMQLHDALSPDLIFLHDLCNNSLWAKCGGLIFGVGDKESCGFVPITPCFSGH